MSEAASLTELDKATIALVRLAARVTAGTEAEMRAGFADCVAAGVDGVWVEELVLQSYLFAGFPRALNAMREFRRGELVSRPREALGPANDAGPAAASLERLTSLAPADASLERLAAVAPEEWRARGEATCATVYGAMYEKLRTNIRALHPALDEWMIVEGYGKVLSRPGLDLGRRELCIVAACAAAGQERQLHSHLHGARNAGVSDVVIETTLAALAGVVNPEYLKGARLLWQRVKGK
jgi:4-carboxymuconolactone decarboxylase